MTMHEEVMANGLLPAIHATNPDNYREILRLLEGRMLKNAETFFLPPEDPTYPLYNTADKIGPYLYGPLADGTFLVAELRWKNPWNRNVRPQVIHWSLSFDPRECRFAESCDCDWEDEDCYCEDTDRCQTHNEYH